MMMQQQRFEPRRIRVNDESEQGGGALPARPVLFEMGQTVITRNAQIAIHPADVQLALCRHHSGDWGKLEPDDWQENQRALAEGSRIFSVYHDRNGLRFYVITEADRSLTTVLLPSDY
jgi:hypothetical protein